MASTTHSVDREVVQNSFRQWEAEQVALDAQLAESVAALEAYQTHLDSWQRDLARERDEVRRLRETIERDQAFAGGNQETIEQINRELNEARQKIASLTTALLTRTEELRELDHQRGEANTELALARSKEQELAAALTAQQQSLEVERHQWEIELTDLREQVERAISSQPAGTKGHTSETPKNGESPKNCPTKIESAASANPVLGSLMEQFGKLRQQRSMSRPNHSKPR